MEGKVKEFNPSFPVETQQQNKLDLYQNLVQVQYVAWESNVTKRKGNVLNTHQDAHHIEATRRIKTRVDQRILPLLLRCARTPSPHHHLLATARTPRAHDGVFRHCLLRISEFSNTPKLTTMLRISPAHT
jgi:hypothetical protein